VTRPGPGEVLIAVLTVALSGDEGRDAGPGHIAGSSPLYRGWAGRVEAAGPGVSADVVGCNAVARHAVDAAFRDVVLPERALGTGYRARTGPSDASTGPADAASGLIDGHRVVPQDALHLLPDTVDLAAAALLGPAAGAAEAFEAAAPRPRERIAVLGAGVVGLLLVQLLAATSPAELVVVDPSADAGTLALRLGATRHCATVAAARVANLFDVVVETTGTAAAPHAVCLLAAHAGRVVYTRPFPAGTRQLDRRQLALRELTLRGASVATPAAWSRAVRAFLQGLLDPRPLITHELSLSALAGGAAFPRASSSQALVLNFFR
jgi:threonine dehydrogenase-like Zn-dependent dehydrogenase